MAARQRRGFNRIELVVVIIIILVLVALLLPSINNPRPSGRRNTCANNLRQTAIALLNYQESHQAFPGYANVVNHKRASWVVPLLPYFERSDLYSIWKDAPPRELPLPASSTGMDVNGTYNVLNPWAHASLSILVCPSTARSREPPDRLDYVVNCGSARLATDFLWPITAQNTWVEDRNSGVFFNRARADFKRPQPNPNPPADAFGPDAGPVVSNGFIFLHDGTANTILLTENLQAGTWATDPTDIKNDPPNPFQSEFQIRQQTGFVWFVTGRANNMDDVSWVNGINEDRDVAMPIRPKSGLLYARPSSAHPGGVNAIFCDGHLRFISEDIDYKVYTQLMTPNGKDAIVDVNGKTAGDSGWDYELKEADY